MVLFHQVNTMQKESNRLRFIDLFAGIGGFRIALETQGAECVFSSEWDKHSQLTYEKNFNEIPYGDITRIDEKDIPMHDIICGGFPCQAFSISGKQKGFEDARGTLFFDIARIAKYHKPKVLFLENVKNFAKHDNGRTLKTVLEVLNDIGYDTYHKVINASNFGLPTARERIYIVAFRKDLNIRNFKLPETNNKTSVLKDLLEKEVDDKYFINRSDIKLNNKEVSTDLLGQYPQKPIRIGTINKGGQGERIYSIYGHAITLSAYGGGVASKTGGYLVDGRIRKLTPRECARVMGFPETFQIPVTDSQAYKQFGNSVAVPVLKEIFSEIIKFIK